MDFITIKFEFKIYIKDSLIFVFDMHACKNCYPTFACLKSLKKCIFRKLRLDFAKMGNQNAPSKTGFYKFPLLIIFMKTI